MASSSSKTPIDLGKQRRRGALSCAECRRLKLRCDRQFPCQSCRKRGCASICPDGALTTGKGNRFILANTEELHAKIHSLQDRIMQLEDGLSVLHESTTDDPGSIHPLLTDELRHIKTPLGAEIVGHGNPRKRAHRDPTPPPPSAPGTTATGGKEGKKEDDEEEDIANSVGTLTLSESHASGRTRFFGTQAAAQFLLGEEPDEDNKPTPDDLQSATSSIYPARSTQSNPAYSPSSHFSSDQQQQSPLLSVNNSTNPPQPSVSQEIAYNARVFPWTIIQSTDWETTREELHRGLPNADEAWSTVECYYQNGAWLYIPMAIDDFLNGVYNPIYHPPKHQTQATTSDPFIPHPPSPSPTQLTPVHYATLYIFLALGTSFNLALPPYHPLGNHYHMLARAALGASGLAMTDSLMGVQCLTLLCYYNQISDAKEAPTLSWSTSGLASKMASAIGLHRDGKRWNIDPEEAERRRLAFWELTTIDAWTSQSFGRPTTMFTTHMDAALPQDVPYVGKDGEERSFQHMKYIYASTLIGGLNEVFGAKRPSYDVVLSVDRRIRDLEQPNHLRIPDLVSPHFTHFTSTNPPGTNPTAHIMQVFTIFIVRETTLIYLHRSYLARALSDLNREGGEDGMATMDPFHKSRYAASVLAAHRSSCDLLKAVRGAYSLLPKLVTRIWYFWVHGFSAAIVLASIVTRAPSSSLAITSLRELDLTVETFQSAQEGCRPARGLPVLLKLRARAHAVYEEYQQGRRNPRYVSPPRDSITVNGSKEDASPEEDDLTMLGGKTRLVKTRKPSSAHSNPYGSSASPSNAGGSLAPSQHPSPQEEPMEESPPPSGDYHPALAGYLKEYNRELEARNSKIKSASQSNGHSNHHQASFSSPQGQQQPTTPSSTSFFASPVPYAGPSSEYFNHTRPPLSASNGSSGYQQQQQHQSPSLHYPFQTQYPFTGNQQQLRQQSQHLQQPLHQSSSSSQQHTFHPESSHPPFSPQVTASNQPFAFPSSPFEEHGSRQQQQQQHHHQLQHPRGGELYNLPPLNPSPSNGDGIYGSSSFSNGGDVNMGYYQPNFDVLPPVGVPQTSFNLGAVGMGGPGGLASHGSNGNGNGNASGIGGAGTAAGNGSGMGGGVGGNGAFIHDNMDLGYQYMSDLRPF